MSPSHKNGYDANAPICGSATVIGLQCSGGAKTRDIHSEWNKSLASKLPLDPSDAVSQAHRAVHRCRRSEW